MNFPNSKQNNAYDRSGCHNCNLNFNIHGSAHESRGRRQQEGQNQKLRMIKQLQQHGVESLLCGQVVLDTDLAHSFVVNPLQSDHFSDQ